MPQAKQHGADCRAPKGGIPSVKLTEQEQQESFREYLSGCDSGP